MVFGLKNPKKNSLLVKKLDKLGILTKKRSKALLKRSKKGQIPFSKLLYEELPDTSEKILNFLSSFYGIPTINLSNRVISKQVMSLIPKEMAEQHSVVIFKKIGNEIKVAVVAPEETDLIKVIETKTGLKTDVNITTPQDIKLSLQKYDSEISEELSKIITHQRHDGSPGKSEKTVPQDLPIIRIVNRIIERALQSGASDIHIEPLANDIQVRYRIDGLLHNVAKLPTKIFPSLAARVKIMSNLKIDIHRRPQDGRFSFNFNDREVAVRVSIMPTMYGQKIVLRLLDTEHQKFTLRKLGLNKRDYDIIKKQIRQPHGMILATGPTGSGKTTTLYTLLHILNQEQRNISTIEDPIEYDIAGINQTQINIANNLTFSSGLRSLLRQDPDILMVGEIRDAETADIAINSALTGHMVLSTLHTNNAFSTPERLLEMKIPRYLIASTINIIIGQRLVRKVCPECRIKIRSKDKLIDEYRYYFDINVIFNRLKKMNLLSQDLNSLEDSIFYRAKGCNKCSFTGYRGRLGIYEVVQITSNLRKLIIDGASTDIFREQALTEGALSMVEDGILKVLEGKTTFEEVIRVIRE